MEENFYSEESQNSIKKNLLTLPIRALPIRASYLKITELLKINISVNYSQKIQSLLQLLSVKV